MDFKKYLAEDISDANILFNEGNTLGITYKLGNRFQFKFKNLTEFKKMGGNTKELKSGDGFTAPGKLGGEVYEVSKMQFDVYPRMQSEVDNVVHWITTFMPNAAHMLEDYNTGDPKIVASLQGAKDNGQAYNDKMANMKARRLSGKTSVGAINRFKSGANEFHTGWTMLEPGLQKKYKVLIQKVQKFKDEIVNALESEHAASSQIKESWTPEPEEVIDWIAGAEYNMSTRDFRELTRGFEDFDVDIEDDDEVITMFNKNKKFATWLADQM